MKNDKELKAGWEAIAGRPLTDQEYFEIGRNVRGLFSILIPLDKHQRGKCEASCEYCPPKPQDSSS